MSKPLVYVAVVSFLAISCVNREVSEQKHATQSMAEPARDPYALGTSLTPEGAVTQDATGEAFHRGGEVFLSVNVAGATVDQDIEVQWVGPDGKVLHRDAVAVPEGSRFAAVSSGQTGRWPEGNHRAVIIINGRKVSERPFAMM